MDTTTLKSLLICGLPSSGKTTFIGALAHTIISQDIETSLKFDGLPKERSYLNDLASTWVACEPMIRTHAEQNSVVELKLKSDHEQFILSIPDLAGESWQDLWVNRNCTEMISNLSNKANGIMMFVNCDDYKPHLTVTELNQHNKEMGESNKEEEKKEEFIEWDPLKHTPTQTMVVDILQSLSIEKMGGDKKELVLVLSAWDLAEGSNLTPAEYLNKVFPLLSQYITASFDFSHIKVIGLSAQGGDLKRDLDKLSAYDIPSERIKLVDNDITHNDITQPINWFLEAK